MGMDFSHANIGQLNAASDGATVYVFNSEKMADKFSEFNKAVADVEETIIDLPAEKQEAVKTEIETLKGEVVKTKPDGNIVRTSLSVLDDIASTINKASAAVKTIAGLIMAAKTFFGL